MRYIERRKKMHNGSLLKVEENVDEKKNILVRFLYSCAYSVLSYSYERTHLFIILYIKNNGYIVLPTDFRLMLLYG